MSKKIHPEVQTLISTLEKGKMSRREFIRYAALLGVSATAAGQMAGFFAYPTEAKAASIQRGGVMRIASPVQKVAHPSNLSWITPTNQLRCVAEYLTYTDPQNVTHFDVLCIDGDKCWLCCFWPESKSLVFSQVKLFITLCPFPIIPCFLQHCYCEHESQGSYICDEKSNLKEWNKLR